MHTSPGLLGVSAVVLIAGIAGGVVLGTVPPMQQQGARDMLPQGQTVALAEGAQSAFPDHYPLITRAGRFEVHELGERGLYSQPRYGAREAYAYYTAEEWNEAGFDSAAAAVPVVAEPAPAIESHAEDHATPLAPIGPTVAEVTPRIVDVAAALAARY